MNIVRDEEGQALVEFGVYLSLFVFILMGIVDYGLLIEGRIQVQEAATAGAIYGTIPGKYADLAGMRAAAAASASSAVGLRMAQPVAATIYSCSPGGATITRAAVCADGGTPLMFVQVTTAATLPAVLSYPGIPSNLTLTGFASLEVPWS